MCANHLDLTCLEDRILFDVAPLDVHGFDPGLADPIDSPGDASTYDWSSAFSDANNSFELTPAHSIALEHDSDLSQLDALLISELDPHSSFDVSLEDKELIVVDRSVPEFSTLIDQAMADRDPNRFEILLVDSDESALEKINSRFATAQFSALHIISHGADGQLHLGMEIWDSEFLSSHQEELTRWRSVLTDQAELLIYGCNVAESDIGQSFIEDLAAMTGTDVAASIDLTGAEYLGGDWQLEFEVGQIDTSALFEFIPQWNSLLANQAPVTVADVFHVDEDTPFVITTADLIGNDSDPDGDPLTLDPGGFTAPAHGDLVDNGDGTFTYTPDENFDGTDAFLYTVEDVHGAESTGSITIHINPENDAPIAKGEKVFVLNSGPSAIPIDQILANDFDPDGDRLSIQIEKLPKNGQIMIVDGELIYIPDPGFEGVDKIKYKVSDGDETSKKVTLRVKVTLPPQPLPETPSETPAETETTVEEPQAEETNEGNKDLSLLGIGSLNLEHHFADDNKIHSESARGADEIDSWNQDDQEQGSAITEFSKHSFQVLPRFTEQTDQLGRQRLGFEPLFVHSGGQSLQPDSAEEIGFAAISQELDNFDRNLRISGSVDQVTFATLSSITSVLTVGYVLWMVRGGMLMASFVSSIPAWQSVDPLNIVEFDSFGSMDGDDESLESIVNQFSNES